MALTTQLRVLIEGDSSSLISSLTKAGRESRTVFAEVSRSAKAEFAAATREADKAFKQIATLQAQANRADKGGQGGLATALRSQAAAKQVEYERLAAVAVGAERKIQTEAAKTVAAHATEASGVSKLGSAYAQQGGAVSHFFGTFKNESGGAAKGVTVLKDAVGGLSGGVGVLGGVTTGVTSGIKALASSAGSAGPQMAGVAAAATAAAVGVGVLAKVTEDGLKHFIQYGGEVLKVQNIVGGTAENASLLAGQFRHFGIDVDAGSKALGIFATNAANNGGKKLRDLGIQIAHTKDGQVDLSQTLINAGDAFKKYGTGAEGAALARGAFGRGGLSIVPILKTERSELEAINRATSKHGLVFHDKDLKDARDLAIAVREVRHSFEGLQVSAAKSLAPFFTKQTEGAANLLDSVNAITQKVGGLGGLAKGAASFSGLVGLPGASNILDAFGGKSSQAAKDQAVLQQALSDTQGETTGFVADMLKAGDTIDEINVLIQQSGKSVDELATSANISPEFDSLAASITATGDAATFAGSASDTLKGKLDVLGQGAISLQSSQTGLASSLANLGKSLTDNGASFDNNTEKGRANREALAQQASGILTNIEAMQRQGATIGEVSAAWDNNVAALTRTLRAAGLTDAQIQGLLRDYGLIPATKETLISAQTADAEAKLAKLIDDFKRLPQQTDLQVNIHGGLPSGGFATGTGSHPRAKGGPTKKGREYEVGERGPELWVASQKGSKPTGVVAHLSKQAAKTSHDTLVRLGIPGGIEPKATHKGTPALLLGTQGPQVFSPPADGVVVNANDTKRLQRTDNAGLIERILKSAGTDKRTLDALARGSDLPARATGGSVKKGETYKVAEKGLEAYVPSFKTAPHKAAAPVPSGVRRGTDGSYVFNIGGDTVTVEGSAQGSGQGVSKTDVEKLVDRKKRELVTELSQLLEGGKR